MSQFVAFVEDVDHFLAQYKQMFGRKMVFAKSITEFKTKLMPIQNKVAIWFLDMQIPTETGGEAEAKCGISVAQYLTNECPNVPRFCTSNVGSLYRQHENLYSGWIKKDDLKSILKEVSKVV